MKINICNAMLVAFGIAGGICLAASTGEAAVSRSIATCGLIMVQSLDRRHVIGIGFSSVQMIYTNTTNRCFHADPYLGDVAPGERRKVDGQLYLMSASPAACLEQFTEEFSGRRSSGKR